MKRTVLALLRLSASTPLAVVLVAALVVLSVAGAALPQESAIGAPALAQWQRQHTLVSAVARPLGLFHAFSSWPFIVALALLAFNLVACTVDRLMRRRATMTAVFGGSLLLHVGLLVVLGGGLVTSAYRFDGTIVATEGQVLDMAVPQSYMHLSRGPLARQAPLPQIKLGLEKFKPSYVSGMATRFDSELRAGTGKGRLRHLAVRVNHPAAVDGFAVTQSDFGYSPDLLVTTAPGRPIIDAYVALTSRRTQEETIYEDFVVIPGIKGRMMLRVYPDFVMREGRHTSASAEPRSPVLWVRLVNPDSVTRRQVLLKPGQDAAIGGFHIVFRDLRYWSAFRVARDPGMPVVYAGFLICITGLIARYVRLDPGAIPRGNRDTDADQRGDKDRALRTDPGCDQRSAGGSA